MRVAPPARATRPGSGRHAGPSPPWRKLSRRPAAAAGLLGGLLVVAVTVAGLLMLAGRPGHPPGPASAAQRGLTPLGAPAPLPSPATLTVPRPVALRIPAIGVRTRLIRLGLTRQGTLQVPPSTSVAGWFTGSPRPGEIGSSVIAGHIDSYRGPGIFYRLRDLRPGNRVYVRQAGGKLAIFQVTAVHRYLKAHFPTARVYGPAPDAELHLITCGGTFDYTTGSYLSNVVVYSTEVR
jgi:Sortase domain